MGKLPKHLIWWNSLGELQKWNRTINHSKHYADLTGKEIKVVYDEAFPTTKVKNKN